MYDADGHVTSAVDRDGRTEDFVYDNDGRLTQQTWYNSSSALVNTQTFLYDQDGNVTGAADANGTYTYDNADRLLNEQEAPFGLSLTYSYDQDG